MSRGRTIQLLVGSHLFVFVGGFVLGKYIDYDELQSYRSEHESTMTRIKRHASQIGLTVVAVGTVAVVVTISSAISKRTSSAAIAN